MKERTTDLPNLPEVKCVFCGELAHVTTVYTGEVARSVPQPPDLYRWDCMKGHNYMGDAKGQLALLRG